MMPAVADAPQTRHLYLTYVLLTFCYFFTAFYRISASVVMPALALEIGMSGALTGFISSLFFYAYAAAQPLGGAFNDRFGPGKVVSAGISIAAAGALCFSLSSSPVLFALGRFLMGLGMGPMLSGSLVFIGKSAMRYRYTLYAGIILTFGNIGAVVSVYPLGASIDLWGRRSVFIGLAVVNLVLAAALMLSARNTPFFHGSSSPPRIRRGMRQAARYILSTPQLSRMLIPWVLIMGSIMALQGLWAVSWFQAAYSITFLTAQGYASFISIGIMVGHFAGGFILPTASHRRLMIIASTSVYAVLFLLFWTSMALTLPVILTAALGFFLGTMVGISFDHMIAGTNDVSPAGKKGSVFGVMNIFPFIGAILFQWLTGVGISTFPDGVLSAQAFQAVFAWVTAVVFLGALLLFKLPQFFDQEQTQLSRQ